MVPPGKACEGSAPAMPAAVSAGALSGEALGVSPCRLLLLLLPVAVEVGQLLPRAVPVAQLLPALLLALLLPVLRLAAEED